VFFIINVSVFDSIASAVRALLSCRLNVAGLIRAAAD